MKRDHYLPSLDGIRGVCILLVIGSHTSGQLIENVPDLSIWWARAFRYAFNGELGVRIFFVLSGFLITYLLLREEEKNAAVSLKNFYVRRFLRVLPVFYIFIIVYACLDHLTAVDVTTCQYLTALTYTKNFGCSQWIDGHLWSLSVEEQFYLLWPTALVLFPKGRLRIALAAIAVAPLFRIGFYVSEQQWLRLFSFFTNMDALMTGCIAGLVSVTHPCLLDKVIRWKPSFARLLALSVIYATWVMGVRMPSSVFLMLFATTLQSCAAAYLIVSYASIRQGAGFRFLNCTPLCYIGLLSYSLYIWQQLFFAPQGTYATEHPFFLLFPFNILVLFLVAWISYYVLEMPLFNLRKRFRRDLHVGEKVFRTVHEARKVA